MSTPAIAIIGYGYWGPKLVRNFLAVAPATSLVIHDNDPARLAQARSDFPQARVADSVQALLADKSIGAAVIATPVASHFSLAREFLRSGRHVLVEKPLAQSFADASELVEEARRRQVCLMVDHTFIYHPAVRYIKGLIDKGELGRICYLDSTRINLGLIQNDVNVLWDLAVHDLAIAQYLISEQPACVQATGFSHLPSGIYNCGYLTLRYKSGLFMHINASWVSPVKVRHILLGGDRKMVLYNDLDPNEPVKIYDSGFVAKTSEERCRFQFDYRIGDVVSPKIRQKEALSLMVEDFLGCMHSGKDPQSDGRFASSVVRILEAADRSIRAGGAIEDL